MDFGSLIIAFPIAVFIIFITVYISQYFEASLPPWRNAIPLGAFEFWFFREQSRMIRRKKRNMVDLTDQVFSRKDGVALIERLIEDSKKPEFHIPEGIPGWNKQKVVEVLSHLEQAIKKKVIDERGYPFVEWENYQIRVIGLGSLLSRAEVAISLLNKGKAFPEDFVYGQSKGMFTFSGWRSRKFVMARQFYYPRKQKKFLGKRRVRVSMLFFIDPEEEDKKQRAEMMNAMKNMTVEYTPVLMLMSQAHTYEDRLKISEKESKDLRKLLDASRRDHHSAVAQTVAVSESMNFFDRHLGAKIKPIRGVLSPVVIAAVPIISAMVGEYGFTPDPNPVPVLIVAVATLAVVPIFASRR